MSFDPNLLPTSKQGGHVLTIMDQQGVNRDDLTTVTNNGMLSDFFEAVAEGITRSRDELRIFYGLRPIQFHTPVDYSIGMEMLLQQFRHENLDLPISVFESKWLKTGIIQTVFELEYVGKKLEHNTPALRRRLKSKGLRPADGRELLSFGKVWGDMKEGLIVIALCPEDRQGKNLRMGFGHLMNTPDVYACSNDDVGSYCHLLAVREVA
jgi:hypothetical protein